MRSDFVEKRFTCILCGDSFSALTGESPPVDVVCGSCGLQHSHEERKRRIAEVKAKRRSK